MEEFHEQKLRVTFTKEQQEKAYKDFIDKMPNPCFIDPITGDVYEWKDVNFIFVEDENTEQKDGHKTNPKK